MGGGSDSMVKFKIVHQPVLVWNRKSEKIICEKREESGAWFRHFEAGKRD